jgi:hypothetical protein
MTFAIRNLSVLAYAQGFTLWHYKAPGAPLAQAGHDGFFDDAADMLAAGDMLMVSAADGGRVLFVTSAQNGVRTAALA